MLLAVLKVKVVQYLHPAVICSLHFSLLTNGVETPKTGKLVEIE